MSDPNGMKRPSMMWVGVSILFLCFAVFLLVTNVLPTRRNLRALETENQKVGTEIHQIREELSQLNLNAKGLAMDPYAVEKEIRDAMRITRPDEKILRIETGVQQELKNGAFKPGR